eukprot:2602035-Prymnesium_polylepis.1
MSQTFLKNIFGSPSSSTLPLRPICFTESGTSNFVRRYGSKPYSPLHACVSTVEPRARSAAWLRAG